MATYNGLICSLTLNGSTVSQTLGTTEVRFLGCTDAVPAKFFSSGQFAAVFKTGVSGTISLKIFGGIGGATYVIAQRDNITAAGSFPIPLLNYIGISGTVQSQGIPRPSWIGYSATGSIAGFTSQVFFCGDYN